ncbi:MAG: GNAT family N-acetyltransferase [Acidimicrobiales bacterium]|nr:GNAT family N-acetyltransferase [Acidimicrobiales bacterium]
MGKQTFDGDRILLRQMETSDVDSCVELHSAVLGVEFIAKAGKSFLRSYYLSWMATSTSVSLVACIGSDVKGVLLGTYDPKTHYQEFTKGSGSKLAYEMFKASIIHPAFGVELIRTRGIRYLKGILRILRKKKEDSNTQLSGEVEEINSAELTHLFIDPREQGKGIGQQLVNKMTELCIEKSVQRVVCVTPPEFRARKFYEKIGFKDMGTTSSKSGENFVRYELEI